MLKPLANAIIRYVSNSSPWLRGLAKRIFKSKWLLQNRYYQNYVLREATHIDDTVADRIPALSIETILTCNARCIMCVHGEQPMIGTMSDEVFYSIVDQAADLGIKYVGLSIYGEPFADKNFLERVKYVRRKGMTYSLFSNGSLFRMEKLKEMLALGGFEFINFSVNGFSTEVYEKVMPPLNRERVYGNINDFLDLCDDYPGNKPFVRISSVELEENKAELGEFAKYWESRKNVDHVLIADEGDWLGELTEREAAADKTRGVKKGYWLSPCPSIWTALYVYYDGRVSPCCEDAASRKLVIGDCTKDTLRDIWVAEPLQRLRGLHRDNHRADHDICSKCHWNQPWSVS